MTRWTRQLIAAALLAVTATLLLASPASAAGESIGSCIFEIAETAEQEYGTLEALHEEGNEAALETYEDEMEDCVEAPNMILPELDEIIWGGLAFLVLFLFMVWKGFPAVKGAMDARADRIRDDLDAAEQAKTDAQQVQADHEASLADAKSEAAQIVDEARVQADALKADLQARAEADVAEMRERAAAEAEVGRQQAIADLRSEVSNIALGAAERVVGSSLDRDAQSALVDQYINEVAGSNG